MTNTIILAVVVLLPVVILTVLRVDAAIAFLSLCSGYVLVQFVGTDTTSLLTAVFPHASSLSESTVKIIFLWLPVVLTLVAMFHTVKGAKLFLNILPAIGVGLLGALLIEPLLPPGVRGSLQSSSLWNNYQQGQTLIVGLSTLVSLIFLWIQRRGSAKNTKHHSKS